MTVMRQNIPRDNNFAECQMGVLDTRSISQENITNMAPTYEELLNRFRSSSDIELSEIISHPDDYSIDAHRAAAMLLEERGICLKNLVDTTSKTKKDDPSAVRYHESWKVALAFFISWAISWSELLSEDTSHKSPLSSLYVTESLGMTIFNSLIACILALFVVRLYWKLKQPKAISKKRWFTYLLIPVTLILQAGRQHSKEVEQKKLHAANYQPF